MSEAPRRLGRRVQRLSTLQRKSYKLPTASPIRSVMYIYLSSGLAMPCMALAPANSNGGHLSIRNQESEHGGHDVSIQAVDALPEQTLR